MTTLYAMDQATTATITSARVAIGPYPYGNSLATMVQKLLIIEIYSIRGFTDQPSIVSLCEISSILTELERFAMLYRNQLKLEHEQLQLIRTLAANHYMNSEAVQSHRTRCINHIKQVRILLSKNQSQQFELINQILIMYGKEPIAILHQVP